MDNEITASAFFNTNEKYGNHILIKFNRNIAQNYSINAGGGVASNGNLIDSDIQLNIQHPLDGK